MNREILNKVKSVVLGFDKNAQVILFGSRARGDEKPASDWDFLIITSFPVDEKKKRELRDQLFYTELETNQAISSVIYFKDYWENSKVTDLYQNITKEGLII